MRKKWLTNVGEESNARNDTLDTGTTFKQIFHLVLICTSYLQLLEKVKNTFDYEELFQACSSISRGDCCISSSLTFN